MGDNINKLLIIGAGQYGFVARDVALSTGAFSVIDFADDASEFAKYKISEAKNLSEEYGSIVVAIGNSEVRRRITEEFKSAGFKVATLVSSRAWVSPGATVSEGCIVEPMAVINNEAQLGRGTFVCAGAVVNHNAAVGDFCHLDCNCTVAARACVPDFAKVFMGQVIN